MAVRKRVIYQSEALYVGSTGDADGSSETPTQLRRIQSANYSFDVARTDVNQFGQLAAVDRIILEQPTVSLDFNYLVTDGFNESGIGLSLNHPNSCIAHFLSGVGMEGAAGNTSTANEWVNGHAGSDFKNYYIVTAVEGDDAVGGTVTGVIGIGNAQLTNYSVNGSVGDFITADATVEAMNMVFDGESFVGGTAEIKNPAVDSENGNEIGSPIEIPSAIAGTGSDTPYALRPGDVELDLTSAAFKSGTLGVLSSDLKVQSFSCSVGISRTPLEKLGSRFAFSREIDFPLTATMDFTADIGELDGPHHQGGATTEPEDLQNLLAEDDSFNLTIKCKPNSSGRLGLRYTLRGAKIDSQSFSSSIGANKSLDMSFSAQIGGPDDSERGLVIQRITSGGVDSTDLRIFGS